MAANPYAGGDVVFNSSPFNNLWLQSYQRRQARDAAQNDYYNKLGQSINTAGVRTQDIEGGLAQKINDWRTYGIQNRAALINPRLDNYKAQNEFYNRQQDILNDTEKSKQAANRELEAGKNYFDAQQKGTATDDDMGIINNMRASIYDNNHYKQDGHTPYTPYDLTFLSELPTQQELEAFSKTATGKYKQTPLSSNEEIIYDKGNKFQGVRRQTDIIGYTPETLKAIGETASGLVNNPKFKRWADETFHNPQLVELYNDEFKKVTGRDIQTPQDAAAAYVINANAAPQTSIKNTPYTNTYAQQQALQSQRFAHENAMLAKRIAAKKKDGEGQGEVLESFLNNDVIQPSLSNPTTYTYKSGQQETQYLVANNPLIAAGLKNGKYSPDRIVWIQPQGEEGYFKGIFYKIDKTTKEPIRNSSSGQYAIDDAMTTKASKEALKLQIGKEAIGQKNTYSEVGDDYKNDDDPLGIGSAENNDPLGILK